MPEKSYFWAKKVTCIKIGVLIQFIYNPWYNIRDFLLFWTIKWRNNGVISGVDSGLNENESEILNVIKTNPSVSAKDLSISLNIPFRSVQRYLSNLKEKGIIERIGSNKSGYWRVLK